MCADNSLLDFAKISVAWLARLMLSIGLGGGSASCLGSFFAARAMIFQVHIAMTSRGVRDTPLLFSAYFCWILAREMILSCYRCMMIWSFRVCSAPRCLARWWSELFMQLPPPAMPHMPDAPLCAPPDICDAALAAFRQLRDDYRRQAPPIIPRDDNALRAEFL